MRKVTTRVPLILILFLLCSRLGNPDEPRKQDAKAEGIEISAKLDKQSVEPDTIVRLQELVGANMTTVVVTSWHHVLQIGDYDTKTGRLINLDEREFRTVDANEDFVNLPASLRVPHGLQFNVKNPRWKGVEYEMRPKRLGVFLIVAYWTLRDSETRIASNPVVLTVRPPIDAKGRPIVKPEWIKE